VPTAARKAGRSDAGRSDAGKDNGRSKGNGRSKDTAGGDASDSGRLPPGQARHFSFAFEPAQLLAGLPFGITPLTTGVMVDEERLHIRYGPWSLTTPLDNVAGTTETGPYQLLKIAGPAHLSLADRGVAFCTRRTDGLCISFHEPVRAIAPVGPLLHPAATVTVSDRDGLRRLLDAR
jgi:hypothetical protein